MLDKIQEITLDGTTYPISFSMAAMEKIEEDLDVSYLLINISAKATRVILYRGIQEGMRLKGEKLTQSDEQLVGKLSLDYKAHNKLWEIFGYFVRKGEPLPGLEEDISQDDDQEEKKRS